MSILSKLNEIIDEKRKELEINTNRNENYNCYGFFVLVVPGKKETVNISVKLCKAISTDLHYENKKKGFRVKVIYEEVLDYKEHEAEFNEVIRKHFKEDGEDFSFLICQKNSNCFIGVNNKPGLEKTIEEAINSFFEFFNYEDFEAFKISAIGFRLFKKI